MKKILMIALLLAGCVSVPKLPTRANITPQETERREVLVYVGLEVSTAIQSSTGRVFDLFIGFPPEDTDTAVISFQTHDKKPQAQFVMVFRYNPATGWEPVGTYY